MMSGCLLLELFLFLFIGGINGCSIAYPAFGTYFVSSVELLDEVTFPDSVLIKIQRSINNWSPDPIGLTFDDPSGGPWYKVMNINDGSVGPVVDYTDYAQSIRSYASSPTNSATTTSVSCEDACDGATASCQIIRNGIQYDINIPYSAAIVGGCDPNGPVLVTLGGIFVHFTIEDISTTYISFSTNMVGIEFNDFDGTYRILNVDRDGDSQSWNYLTPGGFFVDSNPRIFSSANIIQNVLPCCLCYGYSLSAYSIQSDPTNMYDQVITLTSLGFGGGYVDDLKSRVYNWGLGYSSQITVYNLQSGTSSTFEPELCDVIVNCLQDPCQSSSCPYNPTAVCNADYCGGCNARWYCGVSDITTSCSSTPQSTLICPTPTPTTIEPTTPQPIIVDICALSPDIGTGTDSIQRFYYNSNTGRCRRFLYSGSGGNGNNFRTRPQCNRACP